jgi:hypothetical protein
VVGFCTLKPTSAGFPLISVRQLGLPIARSCGSLSLPGATKQISVSYEDPQSLALKCKYVLEHKLASVMFWEYSRDASGTLLGTIDSSLRGPDTYGGSKVNIQLQLSTSADPENESLGDHARRVRLSLDHH